MPNPWRWIRLWLIYPLVDLLECKKHRETRRFMRGLYRKIKGVPSNRWIMVEGTNPQIVGCNTDGIPVTIRLNRQPGYCERIMEVGGIALVGCGRSSANERKSIIVDWIYKDLCWQFRRQLRGMKKHRHGDRLQDGNRPGSIAS